MNTADFLTSLFDFNSYSKYQVPVDKRHQIHVRNLDLIFSGKDLFKKQSNSQISFLLGFFEWNKQEHAIGNLTNIWELGY